MRQLSKVVTMNISNNITIVIITVPVEACNRIIVIIIIIVILLYIKKLLLLL